MNERQPRPFSDTQKAYSQAVVDLIKQHPSIATGDELIWQESQSGVVADVPDSTSIRRPRDRGFTSGVPLSVPLHKEDMPKELKTHSMAQVYLFGKDEVLEDVGSMFGVSRENVRLASKSGVKRVLGLVPQSGYDFSSLNFKKPLSDKSKDKKASISLKIRKEVRAGLSYKELREKGFSAQQVKTARRVLSRREASVIVPSGPRMDWGPTLELLADPTTDRVVVGELLTGITASVYNNHLGNLPEHPAVIVNIHNIARSAELYPVNSRGDIGFLADYLYFKDIPIGKLELRIKSGKQQGHVHRYNFTTVNFVDEAVELLKLARGEKFDLMRSYLNDRKM